MNIGGLFGALTPVFFVLALGYLAGKRNAFDADQSAGLSKLALTFAPVSYTHLDVYKRQAGSIPQVLHPLRGLDWSRCRALAPALPR